MREIYVKLTENGHYSLLRQEVRLGQQKSGAINYVVTNVPDDINDSMAIRNLNHRSFVPDDGVEIQY
jgi:hypothetical protein